MPAFTSLNVPQMEQLLHDRLDDMPAVEETQSVRHVRFERPLKIMMDGKKQHGVVLLPTQS